MQSTYGYIPTFDDPVYIANVRRAENDELNELFDYSLLSHRVKGLEDEKIRCIALHNALANGVKVQDFGGGSTAIVVEEWNAHEIAKFFQYLRYTHHHGICDTPYDRVDPEDVDRLWTCGMITKEDLDFPLGMAMLGVGAYKRIARQTGQPLFDGTFLPARVPWTTMGRTHPPSVNDVRDLMVSFESQRNAQEHHSQGFLLAAKYRPAGNKAWLQERIEHHGRYGLKRYAGIDDEKALGFIQTHDTSFIPRQNYDGLKNYPVIPVRRPTEIEKFPPIRTVTTVKLNMPRPLKRKDRTIAKHPSPFTASVTSAVKKTKKKKARASRPGWSGRIAVVDPYREPTPIPDCPTPPRFPSPPPGGLKRTFSEMAEFEFSYLPEPEPEPEPEPKPRTVVPAARALTRQKKINTRTPSPEFVEEGPVRQRARLSATPRVDEEVRWAPRHSQPQAGPSTPRPRSPKRGRDGDEEEPQGGSPPKKARETRHELIAALDRNALGTPLTVTPGRMAPTSPHTPGSPSPAPRSEPRRSARPRRRAPRFADDAPNGPGRS